MNIFETSNQFGSGVVKSWASLLDANCRAQAEAISRVPVIEGWVALMPDAHFGFGPPVGSVVKCRRAVMPYAVGVDIGCGMIAVKTVLSRGQLRGIETRIMRHLRALIPAGVGGAHSADFTGAAWAEFVRDFGEPNAFGNASLTSQGRPLAAQLSRLRTVARTQFGTLGSGNHFVEVCEDSGKTVWLLLHSGSRGIGNTLATAHQKNAQLACKGVPLESQEFAYLREGEPGYANYLADMEWCQHYAFRQREAMMAALVAAVEMESGVSDPVAAEPINCHHNYAEQLEPGVWLTRKGAIDASVGKLGIIPGSMGAATYIVRGLGNQESYNSSPHGAGRLMGRNEAHNKLNLDDFKASMAGRTWLDRDAKKLLDEAPRAYKPIETVIADSADLVEPVTVLSQFINYKGL